MASGAMLREHVLQTIRSHEPELRSHGVLSLAVFGSVARGDDHVDSDVDVVVQLSEEAKKGGFSYFGLLDTLTRRLEEMLGRPVDVVTEPVRKEGLRRAIERDNARVF